MRTEISAADIDFNKRLALLEYCLWRFKRKVDDFLSRPQGGNEEEVAECQKKVQQAQAAAKAAEQAEKELTVALRNLKQQEDAYNSKTKELEAKTETGGAVAKNKAKAELAQHLGADPLPLSRAKLTTEAAKKKAERAIAEAPAKIAAAEESLQHAKMKGGIGQGTIWWIERELAEAKKYMPQRRK